MAANQKRSGGFFSDPSWQVPAITAAVATGLFVSVVSGAAGDAWNRLTGSGTEASSLVGGCEPFSVVAQNRWQPYGAKARVDPFRESIDVEGGSFAPNELIVVDGWVRTRPAYPQNTTPWNSDAWFHLADNTGWVSFAAVRSEPTIPDETGGFSDEGGAPAPLDEACLGRVRTS